MSERKWQLYRLVITPTDSPPETVHFAAPSDGDALYVLDLHWTTGQRADLCVWKAVEGEWFVVDVAGKAAAEGGEFVTY